MKVLVVGASGFLGSYLMESFQKRGCLTSGTYFQHPVRGLKPLDIRHLSDTEALIRNESPDIVCLCAASPNVDYCEEHPEETSRINVDGTAHTAAAAKKCGAKLVYFSSDYVFDGINGPYRETDTPNPVSEYGLQKLRSEEIVLGHSTQNLILRVTVLYGWEAQRKNFFERLLSTLQSGREIRVPNDQIGSPTLVPNLAEITAELVLSGASGIYHLAGPGCIDRYHFALEAAKIFNLDTSRIIPVTTLELKQKARRPLNAGLLIEKITREISIPPLGIHDGLTYLKTHRKVFEYA